VLCQGQWTMEESSCSQKHYGRVVALEALE
jgi:hypothetical protein